MAYWRVSTCALEKRLSLHDIGPGIIKSQVRLNILQSHSVASRRGDDAAQNCLKPKQDLTVFTTRQELCFLFSFFPKKRFTDGTELPTSAEQLRRRGGQAWGMPEDHGASVSTRAVVSAEDKKAWGGIRHV